MTVRSLTVAVCTRNRPELFERCILPSLIAASAQDLPIVVVDQSDDARTEQLVGAISGVTYLRSAPGLSVGRNVAVGAVTTSIVAFTDDDVTFPPRWPDGVADAFAQDATVGAVLGRAVDPSGHPLPGSAAGVYRWPLNPFGLGSGFNMSFRMAALADAGPFDEALGAGAPIPAAEDTDMLYRVARAGWAVACVDGIDVVHHDWRPASEQARLHFGYGEGAGAQTAKHGASGDRTATRLGAREAARHVRTIGLAVKARNGGQLVRQVAFLSGMAVGAVKGRRLARQRRSARSARPRSG